MTLDEAPTISNVAAGLLVDVTGRTGSSTNVIVNRSTLSGSRNGVEVIAPAGGASASVTLNGSTVSGNIVAGLRADGAGARIIASASTISGNSTGIFTANGGNLATIRTIGNGILIDTPDARVVICGLLISGGGSTAEAFAGIYFVRGESLTVQGVTIPALQMRRRVMASTSRPSPPRA